MLRQSSPFDADKVIAEARSWIGTPWHHAARVKGAGVDCAQFLIAVFSAVGVVEPFETDYYPMDWHLHRDEARFLAYLMQYAERTEEPERGGVAMFRYGRQEAHGAIIDEWPVIIHAYRDEGAVTVSRVTDSPLEERFANFYRLRAK
jgi:cell wall-associated NlpC family hydrolase